MTQLWFYLTQHRLLICNSTRFDQTWKCVRRVTWMWRFSWNFIGNECGINDFLWKCGGYNTKMTILSNAQKASLKKKKIGYEMIFIFLISVKWRSTGKKYRQKSQRQTETTTNKKVQKQTWRQKHLRCNWVTTWDDNRIHKAEGMRAATNTRDKCAPHVCKLHCSVWWTIVGCRASHLYTREYEWMYECRLTQPPGDEDKKSICWLSERHVNAVTRSCILSITWFYEPQTQSSQRHVLILCFFQIKSLAAASLPTFWRLFMSK